MEPLREIFQAIRKKEEIKASNLLELYLCVDNYEDIPPEDVKKVLFLVVLFLRTFRSSEHFRSNFRTFLSDILVYMDLSNTPKRYIEFVVAVVGSSGLMLQEQFVLGEFTSKSKVRYTYGYECLHFAFVFKDIIKNPLKYLREVSVAKQNLSQTILKNRFKGVVFNYSFLVVHAIKHRYELIYKVIRTIHQRNFEDLPKTSEGYITIRHARHLRSIIDEVRELH